MNDQGQGEITTADVPADERVVGDTMYIVEGSLHDRDGLASGPSQDQWMRIETVERNSPGVIRFGFGGGHWFTVKVGATVKVRR